METGERQLHVHDLFALAGALDISVGRVLNTIAGLDSVLDRWDVSEAELTELVAENPSLRGMMLGYAAEMKFRRLCLAERTDIVSTKDDDHDRKRKGDCRLNYHGQEIIVEVKSLQTQTVKRVDGGDSWFGRAQVDASDRRVVTFPDGSQLGTTLLLRGEFDILAVNCFAFGDRWRFVFALNSDLETSGWKKYTPAQRALLIKSMQDIHFPARPPFTEDFGSVLERALASRSRS
jgi:hypothetical protein